jgi:hypothetical protein
MCVNYKPTDAEMLEAMSGLSAGALPSWARLGFVAGGTGR